MKVLNTKIIAWSLFDLGDTAYSALIVTLFFPILIQNYLGGNEFLIGLVIGSSLIISALFVPYVGGISDATNIKRSFLILFSVSTMFFLIMMGSFTNLYLVLILALIANVCYHTTLDIYDSYIPDITETKNYGFVSGFGVAMGYVGTVLSLIMAWYLLNIFGWNSLAGTRIIFPATAVFFFIFALPIYFIRDKRVRSRKLSEGAIVSFKELKKTIMGLKKYKNIWKFLLASFCYVGAVNTAIAFLFLFGQEQLGITVRQFLPLFGLMAICSSMGAYLFGIVSDDIGPKRALIISLVLWICVIGSLMIQPNLYTYLMTGMVGGALLGAIWTSTRPMLIKISPPEKLTELFGFQGFTEKTGGLATLIYGALAVLIGHRFALSSILLFFVLGLMILFSVKEEILINE